ncbi:MAG: hypothetical protein HQK96_02570 [Nitrospirae bacterium]|nr:hypothetical protein [Nitrospirota bacterium]
MVGKDNLKMSVNYRRIFPRESILMMVPSTTGRGDYGATIVVFKAAAALKKAVEEERLILSMYFLFTIKFIDNEIQNVRG